MGEQLLSQRYEKCRCRKLRSAQFIAIGGEDVQFAYQQAATDLLNIVNDEKERLLMAVGGGRKTSWGMRKELLLQKVERSCRRESSVSCVT